MLHLCRLILPAQHRASKAHNAQDFRAHSLAIAFNYASGDLIHEVDIIVQQAPLALA
jgi:hypothetical protein